MTPNWQQPIKSPITAKWDITISQEDYDKMAKVFQAWDTTDRWNVNAIYRDKSSGKILLHFARGSSESILYTLMIEENNHTNSNQIEIKSIIWEELEDDKPISEDWAKREVILMAIEFLGCDLPGLPELTYAEWWPKYFKFRRGLFENITDIENLEELIQFRLNETQGSQSR